MVDVHTRAQRSYNMSKIKGKWTRQEKLVHNYLKGRKVKHKMHPDIEGNPDILVKGSRTLVFLDGCFWHGCPKCFIEPGSNRDFWISKIEKNVKRDKDVSMVLKARGWEVLRIWEHEIRKNPKTCIKRIGRIGAD